MKLPIVRDLSATIEIDPVLELARAELAGSRAVLAELPEGQEHDDLAESIAATEAELAEYEQTDGRPGITIRVIPPAVLASLRSDIMRKGTPKLPEVDKGTPIADLPDEYREALADNVDHTDAFNRELARWGVTGWRLKRADGAVIDFVSGPVVAVGREYVAASWDVVDLIELNGWLRPVAGAVWAFNVLTEEDRKK